MLTFSRTLLAVACAGFMLTACNKKEEPKAPASAADLATDAQKFGYAIGVDLAKSLQPVKADVDIKALEAGLDTVFAGGTSLLDDAAREAIKTSVSKKLQEKQMEERNAAARASELHKQKCVPPFT